MKRAVETLFLLAFATWLFCGCATTRAAETIAVDCAPSVATLAMAGSALDGDNYEARLTDLAATYGVCVVREAVSRVVAELEAEAIAPQVATLYGPLPQDLRLVHGRAWLAK